MATTARHEGVCDSDGIGGKMGLDVEYMHDAVRLSMKYLDPAAAKKFLNTPHKALRDRRPLDVALEGEVGLDRIEQVLASARRPASRRM